jgi:membrane protease YdiL (CAAX protease family)
MSNSTASKLEALFHALVITFAAHALPTWAGQQLQIGRWLAAMQFTDSKTAEEAWSFVGDLLCLSFGILLVAPNPKRYGLCIGDIRTHWKRVFLVIAIPMFAASLVAPFLQMPKFTISLWLISPFAQDLVFCGYLYARFKDAFQGYIHPRIPINKAVLLTASFFSLWHVPNYGSWPWDFVTLQLGYTFLGAAIVGMTRQWTGSMWYVTLAHTVGNFGAWCLSQSPRLPLRFG